MKPRHIFAMIALVLIWGSTWVAIHVLVGAVPPMRSAALRFLLAAALLAPIIQWKHLAWPTGRGLNASLVLSITMVTLPYALIFWSEQHISSGLTALLYASMPLLTTLLTPLMAGRSVPRAAWQAMILGLGAIALVLSNIVSTSLTQTLGAIGVLFAVALQGGSSIYAKRHLQGVQPMVSTSIQFFCAGILLSLGSLGLEHSRHATWSTPALLALLFLSIFSSVISYSVYYWLLRTVEAYQITSLQLVVPIIAVAEGAIILHERLSWYMIVGSLAVLGCVVFVMRARREEDEAIALELSR
ncbi:MAG TPA: EamA family transporter [Acidobacteriaceae bacterium]|jgi:drug/metabolite transporter (DMT)-like permease|nr:EamA family transporter [Acidobacteriaceae bacterium]